MSVAAFVFSLLGVVLAAVPMAIWGMVRTNGGQRRGRALAIAALAVSAAWAVASTLLAIHLQGSVSDTALAVDAPTLTTPSATVSPTTALAPTTIPTTSPTVKPPAPALLKPKKIYWGYLKPTMCVREATTASDNLTVVDCRSAHQEEVIARTVLNGPRKWPGDAAMDDAATTKCKTVFAAYVGTNYDESRLDVDYFTADKTGWEHGFHTLICLVVDPDNDHLTRTLHHAHE